MSASLTLTALSLAADGKTLTGTVSGGTGTGITIAASTAICPRITTNGQGAYALASASVAGTTATLVLNGFVPSSDTLVLDVGGSAPITDSAGNTPTGQTGVAVTNNSTKSANRYNSTNAALLYIGRQYPDGNYQHLTGNGTEVVFVITGTDANFASYIYFGSVFTISVDGGPFVNPPIAATGSSGAVAISKLFSGLSNTAHTVVLKFAYGQAALLESNMIVAAGTLSAVGPSNIGPYGIGYGTIELLGSSTFATNGDKGSAILYDTGQGYTSPSATVATGNTILRRSMTLTGLAVWMYLDGSVLALYLDGVKVSVVGSPAASTWGFVTLITNVDPSITHLVEVVVAYGEEATQGGYYSVALIDAIMCVGGTLSSVPVPTLPMLVGWGDSITAGTVGTQNRPDFDFLQLLGDQFGFQVTNLGVGGDHEVAAQSTRMSQLTALPSVAIAINLFGYNDASAIVGGTETLAAFSSSLASDISAVVAAHPTAIYLILGLLDTPNLDGATRTAVCNAKAAAVTTANNPLVKYIDMTGVINPATDCYDNTHPNAAGYKKIAAKLSPAIIAAGITNRLTAYNASNGSYATVSQSTPGPINNGTGLFGSSSPVTNGSGIFA